MAEFILNEDRFFDADVTVRKYAREIYSSVKNLPIISPHGHVDPRIFAENTPFPDPTELFLLPDHYLYRMLYSQGISLESLGIVQKDGKRGETDPRKIWQIFADNYYLFAGTPSGVWLDYEFNIVFGIKKKLNGENAMEFYDALAEKINSPEFLPRTLFDQFNIEVLTTTDAAEDTLEHHKKIKESGWNGRIIPSFRPDGVTDFMNLNWKKNIENLGKVVGYEISSYTKFIQALESRREFFKSMGATATDTGIESPYTHELTKADAEQLFGKALRGEATADDAKQFIAHMLMESGRMSTEDGLVMMVHSGALRNHNSVVFEKYGLDKGCDIPMTNEYTRNFKEFLNKYGNNPNMGVIIFTLDETNYSREIAPLAGHYPALKMGPAWWFHDSIEGMTRFRQQTTETGGIYNTVGFIDDTRAFVSIPARHDVARRVDSNWLAGMVARHIINMDEALKIAKELTNGLARKAYKL